MTNTETEYPFISKCENAYFPNGIVFRGNIVQDGRLVLEFSREDLEDAVALVREFLLRDPVVFTGMSRETIEIILDKYKLHSEITLLL